MKPKPAVIGLCALLVLGAVLVLVSTSGKRAAAQGSRNQPVLAPDGTIAVPRNDGMTIIAEIPKTTNSISPGKK